MALPHIFTRSLCYVTFTENEEYLRCSKCKCAYYKTTDEQKKHWKVHKKVCKELNWAAVQTLTVEECRNKLKPGMVTPDGDLALILHRLFCLIREGGLKEETLHTIMSEMQYFTRIGSKEENNDDLTEYYAKLWAVPGMPQLLMFEDLRSMGFRKLMEQYPQGIHDVPDGTVNKTLDDQSVWESVNGQALSMYVINTLIRSLVFGRVDSGWKLEQCGAGSVRSTVHYTLPALHRLREILSDKVLRAGCGYSLSAVPSLIHSIKCDSDKLFEIVGPGFPEAMLELASVGGEKALLIPFQVKGFLSRLSGTVLCEYTVSLRALPTAHDQLRTVLTDPRILEAIAVHSPEPSPWFPLVTSFEHLVFLPYIAERLKATPDPNISTVSNWAETYKNLEETPWELTEYAEKIMDSKALEEYKKAAEDFKAYVDSKSDGK